MSLSKEEIEELIQAIHADTGLGKANQYEAMTERFFKASWSAICHQTSRAARFYLPEDNSHEACIYRLMSKAFSPEE